MQSDDVWKDGSKDLCIEEKILLRGCLHKKLLDK